MRMCSHYSGVFRSRYSSTIVQYTEQVAEDTAKLSNQHQLLRGFMSSKYVTEQKDCDIKITRPFHTPACGRGFKNQI